MNNLNKFAQKQLTTKESMALKGGIRLITTDVNEALAQVQELNEEGIPFCVSKNYATSEYCIEW